MIRTDGFDLDTRRSGLLLDGALTGPDQFMLTLRYLYDLNSSGGGTLLRGSELLYRASPSESITLLYAPGQAEPAGWQLGRNDANGFHAPTSVQAII